MQPKKRKQKRSALEILRDKERKRRLVPAVVLRRRVNSIRRGDDPGVAVLETARLYSNKHAKRVGDLIIRSMGLVQTREAVKRRFERDGLDDLKLDDRSYILIQNAINKISEILIFKMVAEELVNDKELAEHLVDLFTNQRFDAMVQKAPVANNQQPAQSVTDRRLQEQHDALMGLVHTLMDT